MPEIAAAEKPPAGAFQRIPALSLVDGLDDEAAWRSMPVLAQGTGRYA